MIKRRIHDASPSQQEWALLFLVLLLALLLRLWQIGNWPPGLYRDEAANGLDALAVLNGVRPIFFAANNGREPAYIYLIAFFVNLLGPTATAVRLGAALIGSLTTIPTYLLARSWFGPRVGLFTALLWATTLWPIHLSRIGLRIILLPPLLALTFWLGTVAYRRQKTGLWLLAGCIYGLSYYTYLAVRFTPVLLVILAAYLWFTNRRQAWRGWLWFGLATAVTLTPLLLFGLQHPDLFLGRTGQVSILNPAVNGGSLPAMLAQQTTAALGMILWRGDVILRHNPVGRPVFDWLMALPVLLGAIWALRHWRQPQAALALLWPAIMLGPTILAADTPHFLRAAGVLPALLLLPALGLDILARSRFLADWLRPGLIGGLIAGSIFITVNDYVNYTNTPDTDYLFEKAARTLAEQANAEKGMVYLDSQFIEGWPSVRFLLTNPEVSIFRPSDGLPAFTQQATLYLWPYGPLDFIPRALPAQAVVVVERGPLARGDLETTPYSLYSRYHIQPGASSPPLANFDNRMWLVNASVTAVDGALKVSLGWSADTAVSPTLTAFVHLVGPNGLVAQVDAPPGQSLWPEAWWRPGLVVHEQRTLPLPANWEQVDYTVIIGLYDETVTRLPVTAVDGTPLGDSWRVPVERK